MCALGRGRADSFEPRKTGRIGRHRHARPDRRARTATTTRERNAIADWLAGRIQDSRDSLSATAAYGLLCASAVQVSLVILIV